MSAKMKEKTIGECSNVHADSKLHQSHRLKYDSYFKSETKRTRRQATKATRSLLCAPTFK